MCSALNELSSRRQRVEKAGTRARQIEAPRTIGADPVLNQAGAGRKEHIGGDGSENDQLDLSGINATLLQNVTRSLSCEIACTDTFFDHAPFTDSRPFDDPFVGRIDDPC